MPTYGRYPLALVRGEGMRVWDDEGKAYLDFAGGLGTMPLGHSHPRWYEAVVAQAGMLTMVSNLYFTRGQAEEGEEPKLKHLRESGAIEQDASMVLFLWRTNVATKLGVAKNRATGELGTFDLAWNEQEIKWTNK